jgi:uncharacterized protein YnzC (UPF0291/DUF896 family)
MKELHNKVNIVPVIAKADSLTKYELKRLKRKVRQPYLSLRRGFTEYGSVTIDLHQFSVKEVFIEKEKK